MIGAFVVIFFALMFLGIPIVFCMIGSSVWFVAANDLSCRVVVEKVLTGSSSFTLMAVPFFILAANLMNSGGITERLFTAVRKFVGHITGGLGHVNIFASVIFAGMSGAAVADAGGLGRIELAAMRQAGFDDDFSLAITAASSTIGPVIPPSIPAVVLAVSSGVSCGALFIGGIVPGLLMALSMAVIVYVTAKRRNYPKDPKAGFREKMVALWKALPALMTPAIIIGGIFSGFFTPTEAAAVASLYAFVLSVFIYKEIPLRKIPEILLDTAVSSTVTIAIIAAAAIFGWVFAYARIPQLLATAFLSVITNKYVALIVIMGFLLVVGCFMETIAAITILTPTLMPIITSLGIDPIHFGIVMILVLMIGLITPPVGMSIFTLANVSGVPFYRIAKACVPYMIGLVIVLFILCMVPEISLFLPNLIMG